MDLNHLTDGILTSYKYLMQYSFLAASAWAYWLLCVLSHCHTEGNRGAVHGIRNTCAATSVFCENDVMEEQQGWISVILHLPHSQCECSGLSWKAQCCLCWLHLSSQYCLCVILETCDARPVQPDSAIMEHTHTHTHWNTLLRTRTQRSSELLVPLGYNPLTISSSILITCPFLSLTHTQTHKHTLGGSSLYRCAFGCRSHFISDVRCQILSPIIILMQVAS